MGGLNETKPYFKWRKKLGDCLVAAGLIDEATLAKALQIQGTSPRRIGQILIEMEAADDVNIAKSLAEQLHIEFLHIRDLTIPDNIISQVPANLAESYHLVPVRKKGRHLVVAMADPLELYVIDDLRFATGLNIEVAIAPEGEIQEALDDYYRGAGIAHQLDADTEMDDFMEVVEKKDEDEDVENDVQNLLTLSNQAPVIKFTNRIIANAVKMRASDIHIEPRHSHTQIRYRIDGIMRDILQASRKSHSSVVARCKILSNMDISVRRRPQDGRARIKFARNEYDLRMSSIPTSYGEKITIRILDPSGATRTIADLGISRRDRDIFHDALAKPQGIILSTGPTGSGKSTTLYACLNELNTPEVNIITVEDPIEFEVNDVNQVQVNNQAGITFASGLRSILRQDPDVVMVGEIRDRETATIAFQAAQTGHLVLSTLHTTDAPSAVIRLIDMGLEAYIVASALNCVIGQRLVRKLCPKCRAKDPKSAALLKRFGHYTRKNTNNSFWIGSGCEHCHGFGYLGRIGLYEMLPVTPLVQDAIMEREPLTYVRKIAHKEGYQVLALDGLRKALQGLTSIPELSRVASLKSIEETLLYDDRPGKEEEDGPQGERRMNPPPKPGPKAKIKTNT